MSTKPAKTLEIDLDWCKGCALCVAVCDREVLAIVDGKAKTVRIERCNFCGTCEQHCPDIAIHITRKRTPDPSEEWL